jgi:hypothetical protein
VRTAPTNWWLARVVSALRSLIAFTAWSSFAHALVMGTMAFQFASQRVGFLWGSVVLAVIGVALIVLAPAKASAAFASPWGLVHDNALRSSWSLHPGIDSDDFREMNRLSK